MTRNLTEPLNICVISLYSSSSKSSSVFFIFSLWCWISHKSDRQQRPHVLACSYDSCVWQQVFDLRDLYLSREKQFTKWGLGFFGRCPNVMPPPHFSLPLSPSPSSEIRGFKVLSYVPLKELPICSQVIRGKQSCVPRPAMPNSAAATEQAGSPVIRIVREHRGSAEQAAFAACDLSSSAVNL